MDTDVSSKVQKGTFFILIQAYMIICATYACAYVQVLTRLLTC